MFLFELLADQPGWPQTLAEDLFGENFKDLDPEVAEIKNAGVLLARLVVDPHSGFSQNLRDQAIAKCAELEIALQQQLDYGDFWLYEPEVVRALFTIESEQLPWVWKALITAAKVTNVKHLILRDCTAIKDIGPLADLNLQGLNLFGTGVNDLSPLSTLTNLQVLGLNVAGVDDLTPLGALTNLRGLSLAGTGLSDLTPLSALTNLQWLDLSGTGVSDVPPLSALTNLQQLYLGRTAVSKEQIAWLQERLPQAEISVMPDSDKTSGTQ